VAKGRLANLQDADGKPVAGAEEGNDRALVHGATADLRLAPRVEELRTSLTEIIPAGTERDLPATTLLAWQLARIEQANTYLAENGILDGRGQPRPVLKVLSTWENSAARLCDQLGLTPTARARLGLDMSRAEPSIVRRMQEEEP
jgi:Phage terminase, small subunit